ncbi:MAG: TIGR03790 family protein, partial [Planctomycetaceae bacterium]|nr:TIGR03790 family protein [Planctomycetaceae bacterium]
MISNSTDFYHNENGIFQWETYGADANYQRAITPANLDFDNNVYHNTPAAPVFNIFSANGGEFGNLGANLTVPEWQNLGIDQHSTTADPQLNADYVPQAAFAVDKGWLSSDVPRLNLFVNDDLITETDGAGATRVMIARSGMDISQPMTIHLSSGDETELSVPSTATFGAGQSIIYVPLTAVDDNMVEPTRAVQIRATTNTGLLSTEWVRVLQDSDTGSTSGDFIAGRGQDLLLIVNPNDEASVRIAGAYQELRHIPDNNILFIEPPTYDGFTRLHATAEEFWTDYVTTIHNAIHDRGLYDQIDFIAALGQPQSFNDGGDYQSLSYGLMQLDQYFAGMSVATGQTQSNGLTRIQQANALHHADTYANVFGSSTGTQQYYVSGLLGVSEQLGNTPDQIIESLRRSVAADGTKPVGTIYFEESDDIRSNTREFQWDAVQTDLNSAGIPFVEESNVSGSTPLNRIDVRGAVVGDAEARLPNGSTYLPGSWADNLTSYGGNFTSLNQTKATDFIAAGAAASSGTVEEPYAISSRFPAAQIFTRIDAGLTLGEAYYESVGDPDILQFIGDILAQPYADIPRVTFTGPDELAVVSGNLTLQSSASVPAGGRATAITTTELYVDGRLMQSFDGGNGQFAIDTGGLSDGLHEFRVVAVANNRAESQGIALRNLVVNNHGRSVSANIQNVAGADNVILQIPLTAASGDGTISRIELRHLGRVVASVQGNATTLGLNLSQLAYGENSLVPVAVFSDGQEVRGPAFSVARSPTVIPGTNLPATADRTPGILAEYFIDGAATSIAESDFTGTPDLTVRHSVAQLFSYAVDDVNRFATADIDGLAIRLTGSFDVSAQNAGEYLWSSLGSSDSFRLIIDGVEQLSYDNRPYGPDRANGSVTTFLGAGRHDFRILLANTGTEDGMKLEVILRGPDGVTRPFSEDFVYTFTDNGTTIAAPTITAPTGAVNVARPQISWTAVDSADGYDVRIVNSETSAVISTSAVTSVSFIPEMNLAGGSYRAEVRTRAGNQTSAWATTTFSVDVTANDTRVVVFDEDFEDVQSLDDVFDEVF